MSGHNGISNLVSIIICTYNRQHLLAETIRSIQGQTYTEWELIIVDDGSEDGTRDMVDSLEDGRIQYIRRHHTGALAEMWNLGISNSKGEYIVVMGSDDIWLPHKLALDVETLSEDHELGYAFCNAAYFIDHGDFYNTNFYETLHDKGYVKRRHDFFPSIAALEMVLLAPATTFRRSCLVTIGSYDTSYGANFEFMTRLAYHFEGHFHGVVGLHVRRHPGNLSLKRGNKRFEDVLRSLNQFRGSKRLPEEAFRRMRFRLLKRKGYFERKAGSWRSSILSYCRAFAALLASVR